jgi:DNA-binding NarL/FixJ family response regulator
VFLVDDHPLILSGIKGLLESQPDFTVIGAANDADSAWEGIISSMPDLVIIDGSLPSTSGLVLMARLRATFPAILALALTLHEEGPYVREFLKAGANGFVLKRSAAEDLLQAIRAVLRGGVYIDPSVASKVFTFNGQGKDNSECLSEREQSVIRLVAEGFSNKEISRTLSIGVKTVETYRARAFEKLGFSSRAALVRHALDEGWLGTRATLN